MHDDNRFDAEQPPAPQRFSARKDMHSGAPNVTVINNAAPIKVEAPVINVPPPTVIRQEPAYMPQSVTHVTHTERSFAQNTRDLAIAATLGAALFNVAKYGEDGIVYKTLHPEPDTVNNITNNAASQPAARGATYRVKGADELNAAATAKARQNFADIIPAIDSAALAPAAPAVTADTATYAAPVTTPLAKTDSAAEKRNNFFERFTGIHDGKPGVFGIGKHHKATVKLKP